MSPEKHRLRLRHASPVERRGEENRRERERAVPFGLLAQMTASHAETPLLVLTESKQAGSCPKKRNQDFCLLLCSPTSFSFSLSTLLPILPLQSHEKSWERKEGEMEEKKGKARLGKSGEKNSQYAPPDCGSSSHPPE